MKYMDDVSLIGLAFVYFGLIYFNFDTLEYLGRLLLYALGSLLLITAFVKKENEI